MPIKILESPLFQGTVSTGAPRQRISVPRPVEGQGLQVLGQGLRQAAQGLDVYGDAKFRAERGQQRLEKQQRKDWENYLAEQQNIVDRSTVSDAFSAYNNQIRDLESDYYGRKLGQAQGVYDDAQRDIDELTTEFSGNLSNDDQRLMFQSLSNTRKNTLLNSILNHQNTEIQQWEKSAGVSLADNAVQEAIDNYLDPEATQDAMDRVTAGINMALRGADPETVSKAVDNYESDIHIGIVKRFLVNDATGARAYYEKNKDEILATEKAELEAKLSASQTKQAAQVFTDAISAEGGTLTEQLEEARKITNPDVRDNTVNRLKVRDAEAQQAEKQFYQTFLDDTTRKVLGSTSLEMALDFANNQGLKADDIKKLRNVARSEFDRKKKDIETDQFKMIEAREKIDSEEITTEIQLLRDYGPDASKSDLKSLQTYFRDGGLIGELKDSTVRAMYKSITGEDAKENPALYGLAWDYVERNLRATKKPATDAELRKWTAQAIADGEQVAGGFIDPDMTYVEAVDRGVDEQWLPTVSSDERPGIEGALLEVGFENTERNRRLWKKRRILNIPPTKK